MRWRIDLFLVSGDMEQSLINVFFGLGPGRIKILGLGDADGNGIHTVIPRNDEVFRVLLPGLQIRNCSNRGLCIGVVGRSFTVTVTAWLRTVLVKLLQF